MFPPVFEFLPCLSAGKLLNFKLFEPLEPLKPVEPLEPLEPIYLYISS